MTARTVSRFDLTAASEAETRYCKKKYYKNESDNVDSNIELGFLVCQSIAYQLSELFAESLGLIETRTCR